MHGFIHEYETAWQAQEYGGSGAIYLCGGTGQPAGADCRDGETLCEQIYRGDEPG